jgi:hypothetical protein
MTTFEDFGVDLVVAEPGGRALAEFVSGVANDNDGAPGELGTPIVDINMRPSLRARNQARIGGEIVIDADIDQHRRAGRADETNQFVG